jgi:hypothetical protein
MIGLIIIPCNRAGCDGIGIDGRFLWSEYGISTCEESDGRGRWGKGLGKKKLRASRWGAEAAVGELSED